MISIIGVFTEVAAHPPPHQDLRHAICYTSVTIVDKDMYSPLFTPQMSEALMVIVVHHITVCEH